MAGSVSAVECTPGSLGTTLTDDLAAWGAGDLVGLLVQPLEAENLRLLVVSNDATSLTVTGDLAGRVIPGDSYRFFDYRLGESSPCIDAGVYIAGLSDDINGVDRQQVTANPPSGPAGGPSYPDMGAHEFDGGKQR